MIYEPEWTLDVLARIRVYHGAQDTGRAAEVAWTEALQYGGVTSGADAVQAVVRHYSTPGASPWITPGDVVAGVRAIRHDRMDRVEMPTPNVHPDLVTDYLSEQRAIREAIADGDFDADLYRSSGLTLTGVTARLAITATAEPLVERPEIAREMRDLFPRPAQPLPVHYGPKPLPPVREVSAAEVARLDAERARQIAALAQTYGAASAPVHGDA